MENLITGLNALFGLFWVQLSNLSTWFVNNELGQIIIFCALISIIISIIIYIITLGKKKKGDD